MLSNHAHWRVRILDAIQMRVSMNDYEREDNVEVSQADFGNEGKEKFGPFNDWVFICPRCGTKQTPQDIEDAGGTDGMAGFSCIGRLRKDVGCDWSLGGLLQIQERTVIGEDGLKHPVMKLAEKGDKSDVPEPAQTHNFYITFGQSHAHHVNGYTFDKDSVAIIVAETENDARDRAFELFGPKWFTSYSEERWTPETAAYFPRGAVHVDSRLREKADA